MKKLIINKSNTTKYFDATTNSMLNNIWEEINIDTLAKSNFKNFESNCINSIFGLPKYKPIFKNIYPIPPKSKWSYEDSTFNCMQSLKVSQSNRKYDLLELITKLIKPLKKYKIGVELSGGLDSSIIISMLLENDIEPFLIGLSSDRFEFRTERHIQYLYKNKVKECIFINPNDCLFYQNLKNCLPHQLPSLDSGTYYSKQLIAKLCQENGVKILLNGNSGDTLCCESVFGDEMPNTWYNWLIDNGWYNENVFNKYDIKYLPVYTKELIETVFKERLNMGFDNRKIWARQYFKNYIPNELVNYFYKSDFVGYLIEGIRKSYFDFKELFIITENITKNKAFSTENFNKLFDDIEKYDLDKFGDIAYKVSFATWINSCLKTIS